jgi:predicted helicase
MLKRHPGLKLPPLTDEPGEKRTIAPDEPFVQILDPATGTATFLVEVIDVIHRTLTAKWKQQRLSDAQQQAAWNDYVPTHLLPRLHAFELLMAPYAIAHMKIGLKLAETGYRFGTEERARIYLTNALEPWVRQLPLIGLDALAHEASVVNEIKRHKRFTIVIGNPPYSKSSRTQNAWIDRIMEEYKRTVRAAETQIQALSDDYSKFLRLAHFTLESSKLGVLGYITNNSWLDGPLFRDMRSSMTGYFHCIRLLNLHGDSRKQFSPPEGKADENVFDIQQGVAVGILSRSHSLSHQSTVGYAELWGTREERYAALAHAAPSKTNSAPVQPTTPFYLFVPVAKDLEAEFNSGWHLYDVFGTGNRDADNHESYGAGFVTQQDKFAIGYSQDEVVANVAEFLNPSAKDDALWDRFDFCSTNQWDFNRAKRELKGLDICSLARRCLYRPFDFRFTVFDRNICTIMRKRITSQFEHKNIGLLTTRRVTRLPYNNVFVSGTFAEYKVASHDRNTIVFPLWIYSDDDANGPGLFDEKRRLNVNPGFLRAVATALSAKTTGAHGLPAGVTPEDIFHYAYAVFHSPGYRNRYAEFLKIDFPRLPLTPNLELFRTLARLGGELTGLHLLESPRLAKPMTEFIGGRNPEVEKVSWSRDTVWVDKGQANGFRGVCEPVWNFHIGGYQVCEKWLKDRKGRKLTKDDISHYQKIVVAIAETIRLMKEIDETIERHGGWPDAFSPSV